VAIRAKRWRMAPKGLGLSLGFECFTHEKRRPNLANVKLRDLLVSYEAVLIEGISLADICQQLSRCSSMLHLRGRGC